jgi:hypothetical protein
MAKYTVNELAALQAKAYAAWKSGTSIKGCMEEFDMNYSQVWNGIAAHRLENGEVPEGITYIKKGDIARARNLEGEFSSWGWLMARARMTEGAVRKAYREQTNVEDRGLRIGKGGRFMGDNEEWYEGENTDGRSRAKHGWIRPIGEGTIAAQKAEELPTSFKELGALCKERGISPVPKSKADRIAALVAPGVTL